MNSQPPDTTHPGATLSGLTAGPRRPVWLSPVVASVAMSIALVGLGALTYQFGRDVFERSVRHRIEAVARLKASLVETWIDDKGDDIPVWGMSPEFLRLLDEWRTAGKREGNAKERLLDYLRRVSRISHYTGVELRDPKSGELRLTISDDADTPQARRRAIEATAALAPVLEDFVDRAPTGGDKSADLVGYFAAVTPPAGAEGIVVHVRIDPAHELFPLIEQWPGDSNTAEVLLVERRGDAVVVLNDSRHPPSGTTQRRIGLSTPGSIGAQLSPGKGVGLHGSDDRGELVFAYAQPVVGTPWLVVGKLDESEAFGELNVVALLAALTAIALAMLGGWWWTLDRRHVAAIQRAQSALADQGRRLAELSRRVVSVQEAERRRLASELHDRTGANLATINLNLKCLALATARSPASEDPLLEETKELLADTIVSVREFCNELRPAVLDYVGLAQALEDSAAQFGRRTGIDYKVDRSGYSTQCAAEVELVLFRIAQEALLNCAKHSRATSVLVTLDKRDEHVTLSIADDGVGFAVDKIAQVGQDPGSGLLHMRERAAFIGGSLSVESAPGKGTRIKVEFG